jgi:hypothetical protein
MTILILGLLLLAGIIAVSRVSQYNNLSLKAQWKQALSDPAYYAMVGILIIILWLSRYV